MSATTRARTALVRAELVAADLDACLVRGTDRFLNEYVPRADSTRTWLTGFDGSTGEAFLPAAADQPGLLAVDGRYELQAEDQTRETAFEVEHVPLGESVWVRHCARV
ncbi:MAG: aminopeptidase P family N-terminal domain-containing protein, partial [Planctomycetes bacterium]|nr:aminopeptidase P family N-terminal domain-containing protein [Planctomycetota bacterium]